MSFTAFNAPPLTSLPTIVKSESAQTNKKALSPQICSLLQSAFADNLELFRRLQDLAVVDESLAIELSNHVLKLKDAAAAAAAAAKPLVPQQATSQASKKRKLDDVQAGVNGFSISSWADRSEPASYTAGDVSFSVPQRKKLRLEWTNSVGGESNKGGLRAIGADSAIEFGISWQDVDEIFALPIPEKAKPQHAIVVVPKNGHGLLPLSPGDSEPIVWTALEPGPKDTESPAEPEHTAGLLTRQLAPFGKSVILPASEEFESSIPQPHRKGVPAYHVKAHRGTKDGFLYFLSPGILFGFKKPLLFLPFSNITSISYTSVLQRTFNLNIATSTSTAEGDLKEEEIEFAMLDQADFAGIDSYVKRHGLHDASLAAGRKAAVFDVNKARSGKGQTDGGAGSNGHTASGEDEEEDGMTEIQRAEMALQDAEDEEEEDYEDEDEDEGGSSEEEDFEEGALGHTERNHDDGNSEEGDE